MSERVLSLISKLLAVREERGATEAEQVNAAEHVQRLLQEHNLTLSEVEAHGGTPSEKREKKRTGRRAVHRHEQRLMECLARNNFCLHRLTDAFAPDATVTVLAQSNPKRPGSASHARFELYRTGATVRETLGSGVLPLDLQWDVEHGFVSVEGGSERHATSKRAQHQLVGREINVGVTLRTYDYLVTAIIRLAGDGGYKANDRILFAEGAVSRLCDRLNEIRYEREREEAAAAPRRPTAPDASSSCRTSTEARRTSTTTS